MEVLFTARFLRSFAKLPEKLEDDAIETIDDLRRDSHLPRLRLHKLSGHTRGYHAISVNYRYRIILKITKGRAICMDIGSHTIYT